MLQILAEEVLKRNKPCSTFKPQSFARVAMKINKKFRVECLHEYVENHLKAVKKEWTIISTLQLKVDLDGLIT